MAFENLCKYCFEDMNGAEVCPHCGKDSRTAVPQQQLLPGTLVYRNRFLIGRALGQDASGIVYLAYDTKKGNKIRIREYLPRGSAERLDDGGVVPKAGHEAAFDAGLKKLRASVEGVDDPSKRHFFFEENGTGYIAQRKPINAQSKPVENEDDEDDDDFGDSRPNGRKIALIAGAAVVVVVIAAVALISMMNGALNTSTDVSTDPTINADAIWIPEETPTPTPYASATFAALEDPDLTWMDYEPDNVEVVPDTETTAAPTKSGETSKYEKVNSSSDTAAVRTLQKKLATLGWLDEDDVTGNYGAKTKQAVKDLQNYINNHLNPTEKLDVDGIAGTKTLQWLYDYAPVKPENDDDADDAITVGSSETEVRKVQNALITLGLLDGSADGVYGSDTVEAVKKFQKRVNQLLDYNVLNVTGKVDDLTLSYLESYADEWKQKKSTTAAPTPSPTPEVKATATPVVVEIPTDEPITKGSAKSDVRTVQRLLAAIGMFEDEDIDGVYGSVTAGAVSEFQEWVNAKRGENTLSVTGEVDALTLKYLEYCDEHNMYPRGTTAPTATPKATQKATEAPTLEPVATKEPEGEDESGDSDYVDADSPEESVSFVQEMLISVGCLDGSADGKYGKGTTAAVKQFQNWMNDLYGEGKLAVTGNCDAATLRLLEDCVGRGLTYGETPEEEEETEKQTSVKDLRLKIAGTTAGNTVIVLDEGEFKVNWDIAGEADCYYVKVTDEGGDVVYSKSAISKTKLTFNTSRMNPGEIYMLSVGALPTDGTEDDIVWVSGQFMLRGDDYYDEPDTDEDEGSDELLEDPFEADDADPEEEEEGEDPNEVDMGEPEEGPTIGEVYAMNLSVDGASNGVVTVSDSVTATWSGEGDVESYTLQLVDESGNVLKQVSDTTKTSVTIEPGWLEPGMTYTLRVGALPVNATAHDIVWSEITLKRDGEKVKDVAAVEISLGGSAYQSDGMTYLTGDTLIVSWNAEGDAESYIIYVETEGGNAIGTTTTTNTSKTFDLNDIANGSYVLHVGAMPENGTEDDIVWATREFVVAKEEEASEEEDEWGEAGGEEWAGDTNEDWANE